MTLTLLNSDNKIPPKNEKGGFTMKGGYYFPKGRKTGRVWISWKGHKIFVNKYLDRTPLYHPEQCKRVLERIRSEIDEGIFDPSIWGKEKTLLFQNAWEVYMKESPCGKARYADRERVFNVNLIPYWEDKSLSEIEEHHIKDWFSKLPNHYSPGSLKNIRGVLRAFLNYFQITRRKVFRYPEVKIPQKAVLWLSPEDQERVFEFIPIQHQGILRFIKVYGCRSSEACNLKKADIDWSKRTVTFRERKILVENELPIIEEIEKYLVGGGDKHGSCKPVKCDWLNGHSGQLIALPAKVSNLQRYVFCTRLGRQYPRQEVTTAWRIANREAHEKYRVPIVNFKNATRHSLVCQMVNEGKTFEEIGSITGNSPRVLERHYGSMNLKRKLEILSKDRAQRLPSEQQALDRG